jgi:uncharacterized protein (TIGR02466 family)
MSRLRVTRVADIELLFGTPVLSRVWPLAGDHNGALLRQIRAKRNAHAGVQISNRGGWQSADDLLHWGAESIAPLGEWFRSCIFDIYATHHADAFQRYLTSLGGKLEVDMNAWANINGRGDWNAAHNHRASHWSGVYYVQTPRDCGKLALLDPRPSVNMMDTGNDMLDLFAPVPATIQAVEGLTVIFPSWLQHYVAPHESDEERVSIAFNLRFRA